MKIADLTGKLKELMSGDETQSTRIEVRQLGIAKFVPVRVIKRIHIEVKYIPSE